MPDVNITQLQKMVFIFNALDDGWIVKKINDYKYKFTKNNNEEIQEINLETFIRQNLNLNNLVS